MLAESLAATQSMAFGRESAVAERAAVLLDMLSRSVLHPYVISGFSSDGVGAYAALGRNLTTPLDPERFRNEQDGPFVITRSRCFTVTSAVAASNPAAIYSNVSLQVADREGFEVLGRDAALLPTLYSRNTGTAVLHRPYVMDRRSALLVRATEEDVAATTLLFVSFLGEAVLGPMSRRDVQEAILLGVYPLPGRQSSPWGRTLLLRSLFGDRPPRLKGQASDLLADLRDRVALLMERLRAAESSAYVLEDGRTDLTRAGDTPMSTEGLRNDARGPFAATRAALNCATALSAGGPFSSVAVRAVSTDERLDLTRGFVEAPLLFSRATYFWIFERPHVIAPRGSLAVTLREGDVNGTTDVNLALHGEVVLGVSAEDLRMAVALGLHPLLDRAAD